MATHGFQGLQGRGHQGGLQVGAQHGASMLARPHTAVPLHLGPPCVMLACTLQVFEAPTPKPHDALGCLQHALPMHALHGVCVPGRGSDPEVTISSFLMWRPMALESNDLTENPHAALGSF